MKPKMITFLLGFTFALGLGISQMTRPAKILAFLDVAGNWDPSLAFVMAGAVGIYYPMQKFLRLKCRPKYEDSFVLPKTQAIDTSLLMGAALFGIGWGLVGFCPGPSITALASLSPEVIIFVIGLLTGMFFQKRLRAKREKVNTSQKRPSD